MHELRLIHHPEIISAEYTQTSESNKTYSGFKGLLQSFSNGYNCFFIHNFIFALIFTNDLLTNCKFKVETHWKRLARQKSE